MKRRAGTGFLVYGRSSASFVSGEFKAQYREVAQFGPNSIIGNNMTDYRVMSILQTELGLGWQSCCGRVRLLAGYQFAELEQRPHDCVLHSGRAESPVRQSERDSDVRRAYHAMAVPVVTPAAAR